MLHPDIIYLPIALSLVGLLYMIFRARWVSSTDPGNSKMQSISQNIRKGALAFLNAEYRLLLVFVILASIGLYFLSKSVDTTSWLIIPAFIIGAVFSGFAGNIGMRMATKANTRTAQAAKSSLSKALNISFGGGIVMGLGVAGLAVLGLSLFLLLFIETLFVPSDFYTTMTIVLESVAGFSLGAESIALFARVGGGIYTKAADVGADLVGKVEAGIPEDDPRNPATIADNVGDNVGDVAGMGADLFGSYVATVLAAMVLGNYIIKDMSLAIGSQFEDAFHGMGPIILPLVIAGVGIITSILGTLLVRISSKAKSEAKVQRALNLGNNTAIVLTAIAGYFLIQWML
ncbi:MAG: sodium/proton-translocating pyrophosphatase, partial [Flavobacteriaceae bacterium]|nr:sodium/proton-translocating pyrophosphatase [Flavobacteriaceae bacterium]